MAEYTHEWEALVSSAVDGVYYNANDRTVIVDWDNQLYRYSDVSLADAEDVVNAPSIGRAAQELKRVKGPGEYLGHWNDVILDEVEVGPGVPDNVVDLPTREFALNDASVPQESDATREFSLATPETAVKSDGRTYEVVFNSNSATRYYTPKGVNSVDEAVAAVQELFDALGVEATITQVVVTLG